MHFGGFNACDTIFARTKSGLASTQDTGTCALSWCRSLRLPELSSRTEIFDDAARNYWGAASRAVTVDPAESC